MVLATSWEIGISPDSIVYIDSARHISNGNGYITGFTCGGKTLPVVHWPPLFPSLLSIPSIFKLDPIQVARWFNIFLFACNILLVGIIVHRFTDGSVYITVFGSLLILSSTVMINIHSMAWSEPLFIFLGLLGLIFLTIYLQNEKPLLLISSSLAIALAFFTRYVGIALVLTGVFGILLLSRKKYVERIILSLSFLIIGMLPATFFFLRNYLKTGHPIGERALDALSYSHLNSAFLSLSSWLFPGSEILTLIPMQDELAIIASVIFIFILLTVITFLLLNEARRDRSYSIKGILIKTPILFLIFNLIYTSLLIAAINFFDSNISLDNRILSPVYVSGIIIVLFALHKLLQIRINRSVKLAIISTCVVFTCIYFITSAIWITYSHNNGRSYSNKLWQNLGISEAMSSIPPNTPLYSNHPSAIYLYSGRSACSISSTNTKHPTRLSKTVDKIRNGFFIDINVIPKYKFRKQLWQKESNEFDVVDTLSLKLVKKSSDISIYKIMPQEN